MSNVNEKNRAIASYVVNFHYLVEQSTNRAATYIIYLNALKKKHSLASLSSKTKQLNDKEKADLIDLVQEMKALVFNCYAKIHAFKKEKPAEKEKAKDHKTEWDAIDKHYKSIIDSSFIIDDKELKNFIFTLNSLFVKNIGDEFLLKSQDIIEGFGSGFERGSQ